MYIQQARKAMFPEGTGWAGALNLYRMQNEHYPVEAHYIRAILALDTLNFSSHIEDEADISSDGSPLLKIILDTGSLHWHVWTEIQIPASVVFCHVFLNWETAIAHQHVFSEIEKFVKQDTGQSLRWCHLHASMIDDYNHGILQWTADAHKGQAKGLGLHLQTLAQRMPDTYDMHELDRLLCDLTPYDHLHHCISGGTFGPVQFLKMSEMLCEVSYVLSIQTWIGHLISFVLKVEMLVIWVKNKVDNHFMLEAMCWELSFIPLDIRMSGEANDNLVESTHFNINLEGKSCTLVGGIETGWRFDSTKMATLRCYENFGIRPTYAAGHKSENLSRGIKRHFQFWHKKLQAEDDKIESYN
ncbi:hypothetical protein IW261DRAFT_1423538 [Armillaria novae-zelandiae]|uniref:Uncharacterized protein n=1 Tax=Armillaria novae-zelandiae TaxID=153914 RepID=A0AA39NXC4_9AGAR|nr:hypothetical protein IW261DRAFT_1423538 [Armillaria novae-zelandiae]